MAQIGAQAHPLEPPLASPVDDFRWEKPAKGVTGDRAIVAAAHPQPGRDLKAELDERLGDQRMKEGTLRKAGFRIDEVLDSDQGRDMLELARKSESRRQAVAPRIDRMAFRSA